MTNSEEMMRAALLADSASDTIRQQTNILDEHVRRIERLFEPGYPDNAAQLIYLLQETLQQPAFAAQPLAPLKDTIRVPFVSVGQTPQIFAQQLPALPLLLGLACYPYHRARQQGMAMQQARFQLQLMCNGALLSQVTQEGDFHPHVAADLNLVQYHVSHAGLSPVAPTTAAPDAPTAVHQLYYTLTIDPIA